MQKHSLIIFILILFSIFIAGCASQNQINTNKIENRNVLQNNLDLRFLNNQNETITDKKTDLIWCSKDSYTELGKCMSYDEAKKYVKELTVGGHKDWRLPTVNELFVVYNTKPEFNYSGAKWYWASNAYWKGYHKIAGIVRPETKEVFKREFAYQIECGYVHAVRP